LRLDVNGNCVLCDRDYTPENGFCVKKGCPDINNCVVCEALGTDNTCYLCDKDLVLHTYNEGLDFYQECIF